MLVETSSQADDPSPASRHPRRKSGAVVLLLALAALVVLVLRHDYWNWDTPYPLLFGFLPVGLWWQGLVSLLAAGLMALMVRFAWPGELEEEALEAEKQRVGEGVRG
jgi:hypothetical protein